MPLLLLPLSSAHFGTAPDMPTIYLEWSPTTGPRDAPVWERIPLADIRSIDINRGRNRELDQFQAGRMSVVLDNRDRLYDPQYSAGANFGNVKPMKRVRLRAVWDTTYDLFSGFVDSWDQDYEMTDEATVVVTATDGFKVLSEAELLSSAYAETVQDDGPAAWWRLNEGVGSTRVFDASGNGNVLTVNGTPTFGTASLNEFDSDTALQITAVTEGAERDFPVVTNGPLSVEMIVRFPAGGAGDVFVAGAEADAGPGWSLQGIANSFVFSASASAGSSANAASATSIALNTTYHVVGVWEADGTTRIYVNGEDDDPSPGVEPIGDDFAGTTSIAGGSFGSFHAAGVVCIYDEVAIYDYALTAADVTRHFEALTAPWNGDTTGARIDRLLDALGWPAVERNVDTGESTLQSATLSGSALDHANQVRLVEFGELFFTPDGKVRFISRHNKWLPPYNDPLFTLSDDGSDIGYGKIKFNYDDQLIRNRVTIGYEDGLVFTANSTASQDDFFIKSYSQTGLIGDVDSEAVDYASYVLGRYDEPLLRVQGITITPQRDPDTHFPNVLSADLVFQVNVERTPQSVGSAIDIDYTIEGVSHHIEPKFWRTELQLSPADTPGAFILDSTSQGILDTNALGF